MTTRLPAWAGGLILAAGRLAAADPSAPADLRPEQEWAGSVDAESLQGIAPPVVATPEGWGILWRAWGRPGDPPAVDFGESVVVVSTTRGGTLSAKYRLDAAGDLRVLAAATRDLRPGFRYVLAVVPRVGVASIDGRPAPPHPGADPVPPPATGKTYAPATPAAGHLRLVGSTTLGHLTHLWADGFARFHPKAELAVDPEGSEEGLHEVGGDKPTVAAVSRPVPADEVAALEMKTGRTVSVFPVCEDEIAVVVHPSNPVAKLTPDQLKRIYAADGKPLTWGDLGLTGDWAGRAVALHGRGDTSGTRRFLRGLAVPPGGAERPAAAHDSDRQVVEAVAADPAAIGYVRAARATDKVKSVPVGAAAAYLRRRCHLVVSAPRGEPLPAVVREFLTFVYRLDGQQLVFQDGFEPLDKDVIGRQLGRLGVDDTK